MNDANRSLVVRWHEEGINQQHPGLALQLCSENFKFHFAFITPDYPKGAAALRHWAAATFEFFPDFSITLDDLVCEETKVAFRAKINATHGGETFGVAPTNKTDLGRNGRSPCARRKNGRVLVDA